MYAALATMQKDQQQDSKKSLKRISPSLKTLTFASFLQAAEKYDSNLFLCCLDHTLRFDKGKSLIGLEPVGMQLPLKNVKAMTSTGIEHEQSQKIPGVIISFS